MASDPYFSPSPVVVDSYVEMIPKDVPLVQHIILGSFADDPEGSQGTTAL